MKKTHLTNKQKESIAQLLFDNNIEELKKLTSPLELHVVAANWNWDDGCELLTWIIRNPICDKGTALLIYWHAGPGWQYQFLNRDEVPKYARANYDLIKEIETRYISGFYTEASIAFDPSNDEETDWTTMYAKISTRQEIPKQMRISTSGISIDRSFAL